jgi:N-methylhydantoinase A
MRTFDAPAAGAQPQAAPSALRQVYFNGGDACDAPVLRRSALSPGLRIAGPAVIEEKTSTTVLYPGQRATVDAYLSIEVELPS